MTSADYLVARQRLRHFATTWHEIVPTEQIRSIAGRMLRIHTLKAADALQLAAAMIACDMQPEQHVLITEDDQLARAALKEGFEVA